MFIVFLLLISLPAYSFFDSQETKDVRKHCATPFAKILEFQKKLGPLNKKNAKKYQQSNAFLSGQLKYQIPKCANIKTKKGSDLYKKQKDFLFQLYNYYIGEVEFVDEFGTPSAFNPSYQNMFTPKVPFSKYHNLCQRNAKDQFKKMFQNYYPVNELMKMKKQIEGKTKFKKLVTNMSSTLDKWEKTSKKKFDVCQNILSAPTKFVAKDVGSPSHHKMFDKLIEEKFRALVNGAKSRKILRIVYFYKQPKSFDYVNKDKQGDGTVILTPKKYHEYRGVIYSDAGKFVEGHIFGCKDDHIYKRQDCFLEDYSRSKGTAPARNKILKKDFK